MEVPVSCATHRHRSPWFVDYTRRSIFSGYLFNLVSSCEVFPFIEPEDSSSSIGFEGGPARRYLSTDLTRELVSSIREPLSEAYVTTG